jgi:hypothetical protein
MLELIGYVGEAQAPFFRRLQMLHARPGIPHPCTAAVCNSRPMTFKLALVLALAAASASAQLATPLHATSRPEIRITSWASTNATAYGLASALINPDTVALVNSSYSGDRQAAGYANFTFVGVRDWFELMGPYPDPRTFWGFQPPHYFCAQWGSEGVLMATARINGPPLTSSLTKVTSLASGAPTGAIRAVKLTMFVRAKYDGNLRVRWNFADAAHPTAKATYNAYASSNNTIRISINGEVTMYSGCAAIFAHAPFLVEATRLSLTHTPHRRASSTHSPEPLCVH